MAWEWSHSVEAYQNVEANIRRQNRDWLRVVWSEWEALTDKDDEGLPMSEHFDEEAYRIAYDESEGLPDDVLAESIIDRTNEHRTCTNGGHFAYCCPFNCTVHSVPFDLETDGDDGEGDES